MIFGGFYKTLGNNNIQFVTVNKSLRKTIINSYLILLTNVVCVAKPDVDYPSVPHSRAPLLSKTTKIT